MRVSGAGVGVGVEVVVEAGAVLTAAYWLSKAMAVVDAAVDDDVVGAGSGGSTMRMPPLPSEEAVKDAIDWPPSR